MPTGDVPGFPDSGHRPIQKGERLSDSANLAGQGDAASALRLIEALTDARWSVRREAADALARCVLPEPALRAVLLTLRKGCRDLGLSNGLLPALCRPDLDVLPILGEFLHDPDADLRIFAALAMGQRGDPQAVPALIEALADADANVRCQAIESLGKLRSAKATNALVAIAMEGNFATAWPALDALAAIGDARIAPRLFSLLLDQWLAAAAASALGRLGDEEAVPPLLDALDGGRVPAPVVARALADMHERYQQHYGKGDYLAELVGRLLTASARRRLFAASEDCAAADLPYLARMLGWLDGQDAIDALTNLLKRPEAMHEAGEALVRKRSAAASGLFKLLQSGEGTLVRKAIELLGRMGNRDKITTLISFLVEDDDLAITAASALSMIGDVRAYPALAALLGHPRAVVRQAAVAAVHSVAHPDREQDVRKWLTDASPLLRESAVRIACYLGYCDCMDLILACCRDENEQVRKAAVENLALLEDDQIPDALIHALRSDTPVVRAAACRSLALANPGQSQDRLAEALGDTDVWVRYFAARALAGEASLDQATEQALERTARSDQGVQVRIAAVDALARRGGVDRLAFFSSLVEAEDPDLIRAALKALGVMRNQESILTLVAALDRDERDIRRAALAALGESGTPEAVEPLARVVMEQEPELGQAALEALGRLDQPEAISALVDMARWPRWRETCIAVLVRHASERTEWVARGLHHENLDVRRAVVEVLSRVRRLQAMRALQNALEDEEPSVRFPALATVAQSGSSG